MVEHCVAIGRVSFDTRSISIYYELPRPEDKWATGRLAPVIAIVQDRVFGETVVYQELAVGGTYYRLYCNENGCVKHVVKAVDYEDEWSPLFGGVISLVRNAHYYCKIEMIGEEEAEPDIIWTWHHSRG